MKTVKAVILKPVKAVPIEKCGATYIFDWLPCILPKGHAGLHHGEVDEPGRKASMDWAVSITEVRRKKK